MNDSATIFFEPLELDITIPKYHESEHIDVAIDTEYSGHTVFSAQVYFPKSEEKIIIINNRLFQLYPEKEEILRGLKDEYLKANICTSVRYMDLENDYNNNLSTLLEEQNKKRDKNKIIKASSIKKTNYCCIRIKKTGYITYKNKRY